MLNPYRYIIASFLFLSTAFSSISVQGVLRDPLGKTVEDGFYTIEFRIYNVETGGSALWYEEIGSVAVQHGVFSEELGNNSIYPMDTLAFRTIYYIGVTVEPPSLEMTPRTKLTTSPYSKAVFGEENVFPSYGSVGVGTTSPDALLHMIENTSNSTQDLLLMENSDLEDQLRIEDDGTLTIPTVGAKLGIGTDGPEAVLDINSSGTDDDFISIKDGNGDTKFKVDNDGTLTIPTVGAKLGIGTDGPEAVLDINSSGTDEDFISIKDGNGDTKFKVDNDGTLTIPTDGGAIGIGTDDPEAVIHVESSESDQDIFLIKDSDGVEQLKIDSNGDMSITNDIIIGSNAAIQFSDGTTLVSSDFAGPSSSVLTPADADINADYGGDGIGDINFKINGVTKASISNNGDVSIEGGTVDMNDGRITNVGQPTSGDNVVSFDDIYPVGSIYMNATVSTNPGTLLGVGTWVEMGEGKVLLGESSSYAAEATGGETSVSTTLTTNELPNHTHTHDHGDEDFGTNAPGDHTHGYNDKYLYMEGGISDGERFKDQDNDARYTDPGRTSGGAGNHSHTVTVNLANKTSNGTGSGNSFTTSVMQPYVVVYMWYRTQ